MLHGLCVHAARPCSIATPSVQHGPPPRAALHHPACARAARPCSKRVLAFGAVTEQAEIRTQFTRESIIDDYRVAFRSRQASLIGRKEVLTGKAKFGIFGDGKEVAQLAMARAFRPGDWRSGYYRDQTFLFPPAGGARLECFSAQLAAAAAVAHAPWSGGRSMNAHFASRLLGPDGAWRSQ